MHARHIFSCRVIDINFSFESEDAADAPDAKKPRLLWAKVKVRAEVSGARVTIVKLLCEPSFADHTILLWAEPGAAVYD